LLALQAPQTQSKALQEEPKHAPYRHSKGSDVLAEHLAQPVDFQDLKKKWLATKDLAESLILQLPPEEVGCLYLDGNNTPVAPDPSKADFACLKRHFGSVKGAWPRIL
jgi:hypothetical protein